MNGPTPTSSVNRTAGRPRSNSSARASGAGQISSAVQLNATHSVNEDDRTPGTMPGDAKKFLTAFQVLMNKQIVADITAILEDYDELETANRRNHKDINKLDSEINIKNGELRKKDEELAKAHERIKQLEVQLEQEREATVTKDKQLEKLKTNFEHTRGRLETLERYAEEKKPASKEEIIKHLDEISASAFKLVDSYLSQDLDENIFLEGNWKVVRKKFRSIALPPSNSQDAKRMRVIAVLGYLAQEAADELFLPAFITRDGDEIITILDSLSNTEHSDWLRRSLLGTGSKLQSDNAHNRATIVVSEVFATVSHMIPENKQSMFKGELRKWANTTATLWMEYFQRLESRIEPVFPDKHVELSDWKPFLPSDKWFLSKNKQPTLQSIEDIAACVWPAFYTVTDDVILAKGLVVTEAQAAAAKDEDKRLVQAATRDVRSRQRRDSRSFLDRRYSTGTGGS